MIPVQVSNGNGRLNENYEKKRNNEESNSKKGGIVDIESQTRTMQKTLEKTISGKKFLKKSSEL